MHEWIVWNKLRLDFYQDFVFKSPCTCCSCAINSVKKKKLTGGSASFTSDEQSQHQAYLLNLAEKQLCPAKKLCALSWEDGCHSWSLPKDFHWKMHVFVHRWLFQSVQPPRHLARGVGANRITAQTGIEFIRVRSDSVNELANEITHKCLAFVLLR